MNNIEISVIIPTYKPKGYLKECLESLDKQTLDKSKYEIIVVLNGCNAPFLEYINQIVAKFKSQTIIMQTDVPGVSNARNEGISIAKGEYISFIDDDDYVSECYLEELLAHAAPDTIPICNAIAFMDETREEVPTYKQTKWYKVFSPQKKQQFSHIRGFFTGPWMKLYHRGIIGDRRFDTRFKNGEDALFNFLISNRFKYVDFTSPEAIYYRRYRQNSAISNLKFNKEIAKNTFRLLWVYTRIFFGGKNYSLRFYVTRVYATLHTLLRSLRK